MPVIVFNDKDDLQHELLRRHGVGQGPPVVHQVPSTADLYEAVRLGLGWAMLPEPQARADLAAGVLIRLSADVIDDPAVLAALAPRLAAAHRAHRVGPHRGRQVPAVQDGVAATR